MQKGSYAVHFNPAAVQAPTRTFPLQARDSVTREVNR